jgi:hypothetical protein
MEAAGRRLQERMPLTEEDRETLLILLRSIWDSADFVASQQGARKHPAPGLTAMFHAASKSDKASIKCSYKRVKIAYAENGEDPDKMLDFVMWPDIPNGVAFVPLDALDALIISATGFKGGKI